MSGMRSFVGDKEIKPVQFELMASTGRLIWVSPEHPRLYEVAKEAEMKRDRALMDAVALAALEGTE